MNAFVNSAWLRSMTRRGLLYALLCATPVAIVSAFVGGATAVIGWSLAVGLAGVYFVAGIVGDALAVRRADAVGMSLLLAGFALRAAAVALVMWLLASHGLLAGDRRSAGFVWTILAMVLGWTVGVVDAHRRARLPIYAAAGGNA